MTEELALGIALAVLRITKNRNSRRCY